MKIKALIDHKCSCCGDNIKKDNDCYVYLGYPTNDKEEFTTYYECVECTEKELRHTRR